MFFFSQRAACSACHRVGTRGEKIGPDLSKIGEVRNQRDLLEALVFPAPAWRADSRAFTWSPNRVRSIPAC